MINFSPRTEKYSLEFEILALPKMPNQLLGSHWRRRVVHAKKWTDLVALATNQFRPPQPLTSAALRFVRISSAEPDYDGLCGSFKALADALVKNGIILDDSPGVIGVPDYRWEKGIRGYGKVRVSVTEI